MGEGHRVVLQAWEAVGVSLQVGPLVVREGHGEEGLGIADELVHVALPCHLNNETITNESNSGGR